MSKRAVELVAEAANFAFKQVDRKVDESTWSGVFSGRLIELVLADVIDLCEKNPEMTGTKISKKIQEIFELE